MIVVFTIIFFIMVTGIIASIRALQCPNCYKNYKWHDKKRYGMLEWQDVHQRDICKRCGWFVYAKDFEPPKTQWLKWLQAFSPLKQFNIMKRRKK